MFIYINSLAPKKKSFGYAQNITVYRCVCQTVRTKQQKKFAQRNPHILLYDTTFQMRRKKNRLSVQKFTIQHIPTSDVFFFFFLFMLMLLLDFCILLFLWFDLVLFFFSILLFVMEGWCRAGICLDVCVYKFAINFNFEMAKWISNGKCLWFWNNTTGVLSRHHH